MAKVKGRVTRVRTAKADNYSRFNGLWYVVEFRNTANHNCEIVSGTADIHLAENCYIEFDGEWSKTDYGDQWVLNKGSIIHGDPLKDKTSMIGYLSNKSLYPTLNFLHINAIYAKYGFDFASEVLNNPDAVQRAIGLSDADMDCLTSGVREDFPTVYLENRFPTMRNHKNLARKILSVHLLFKEMRITMAIVDSVIGSFRDQPYAYVGLNGISLREVDDVVLTDFGWADDKDERCIILIRSAVMGYIDSLHCTYVNLSNEQEARYFATNFLTQEYLGVVLPPSLVYKPYRTVNGDAGLFNLYYNIVYKYYFGVMTGFASKCLHLQNLINGVIAPSNTASDPLGEVRLYPAVLYDSEEFIAGALYEYIGVPVNFNLVSKVKFWLHTSGKCDQNGNPLWLNLTDEQLRAVIASVGSSCSFISGGPGRGKSYIIQCLVDFWQNCLGRTAGCFAPTGRAADRLRAFNMGCTCETVKHFTTINKMRSSHDDRIWIGGFACDRGSNVLIVVDETSMLDYEDAAEFLKYTKGCHLVFVGDVDQLQPVGLGSFMLQVMKTDIFPVSFLTKNFRTNVASLAANADAVAAGKLLKDLHWDPGDGESDMFMYMPAFDDDGLVESAISAFGDFRRVEPDLSSTLLLAPTNRICYNLNVKLQDIYNVAKGMAVSSQDWKCPHSKRTNGSYIMRRYYDTAGMQIPCFAYNERSSADHSSRVFVRVGDRVINTKNHSMMPRYELDGNRDVKCESVGIFNGDRGTVTRFYASFDGTESPFVEVLLDNGWTVYIDKFTMNEWKLGYALTVHRSQGDEADNVIVCMPTYTFDRLFDTSRGGKNPMLTKNLLYTAITRAKKNLMLIGSRSIIDQTLQTPSISYNDALSEMILSKAGMLNTKVLAGGTSASGI